jgi:hypothetical protein
MGLLLISRGRVSKRLLSYINLGFFFTFLAVLLYLEQFDALRFYLEQCILWASSAYVGAPVVSVSLIADLLWIPFFAGVSALVFLIYFKLGSRHVSTQLSIFSFFSALFLFAPVLSGIEKVGPQSLRNPRILLIIGSQKAQFSYAYFVLITSMILLTGFLLLMIRKRGNTLTQNQSPFKLAIALIGISSLSQLYPFADNYHIAFISPILILAAIIVIPKKIIDFRVQKSLNWLLLTLIPMLFLKFYWEASTERIPFESSTLKGMYGSWRTASSLDRTMQKLELQEPGIDFVCADGLYAGAGGRYLANNEKFVTWGPPTEKSEIGDRLFICYANQQLIDSYLNSGWTILFKVFWRPMDVSQKIPTWNVLLTTKKE